MSFVAANFVPHLSLSVTIRYVPLSADDEPASRVEISYIGTPSIPAVVYDVGVRREVSTSPWCMNFSLSYL